MSEKTDHPSGEVCIEEVDAFGFSVFSKGGTAEDRHDMHRVGKKQELRVRRRLWSYIYLALQDR